MSPNDKPLFDSKQAVSRGSAFIAPRADVSPSERCYVVLSSTMEALGRLQEFADGSAAFWFGERDQAIPARSLDEALAKVLAGGETRRSSGTSAPTAAPLPVPPAGFDVVKFANSVVLKDPPVPFLSSPDDAPIFIRALDDHLAKLKSKNTLLLPNLHNDVESIAIFSDYGGDQGSWRTYSFLVVGWNALHGFFEKFEELRARHGLDVPYKEIGYKSMGYGPQARALDDILLAAEHAPGLLFNLIVEDKVQSILAENSKKSYATFVDLLTREGLGEWKGVVAERLLRIVHCVSYLTALLARDGHKAVWMTDHDAIAANPEKTDALGRLFGRVLRSYARTEFGTIGYALPFTKEPGKPDLTDLLSIADLAAGSIGEFYTAAKANDPQVKEGTNKILMWLSRQGIVLKRLNLVVRCSASGDLETAVAEFVAKDSAEQDVSIIPIYLGK